MKHADVALAIASCVYPAGLKRLLNSIQASEDLPGRIVVCLDGNEGWSRLDQMDRYRERFSSADQARLQAANAGAEDYAYLENPQLPVEILRNSENLGPVAAFNRLYETAYLAGYVALVNDDVRVQPGWLACLVTIMERYPSCVLTGYSNLSVEKVKGFPALDRFCHVGAANMLRGVYARELINTRGYVEDPGVKVLKSDIQRMTEPAGRGHDVVTIAEPNLIIRDDHQSLGNWVATACAMDNRRLIEYTVNNGARGLHHRVGRYGHVRMTIDGQIIEDTFAVPHYQRTEA